MNNRNLLDIIFIITAFLFQGILITHFALRKWRFEIAIRYGPIVYALSLPAAMVSTLLMVNHAAYDFCISGYLYLIWAIFGYWVEYVNGSTWRNPVRWSVLVPYISLYLATVMFYWWPLALIHKPLWYIYTPLFLASTYLNATSHKRGETISGKPITTTRYQRRVTMGGSK